MYWGLTKNCGGRTNSLILLDLEYPSSHAHSIETPSSWVFKCQDTLLPISSFCLILQVIGFRRITQLAFLGLRLSYCYGLNINISLQACVMNAWFLHDSAVSGSGRNIRWVPAWGRMSLEARTLVSASFHVLNLVCHKVSCFELLLVHRDQQSPPYALPRNNRASQDVLNS